jgi:hypothetical protein
MNEKLKEILEKNAFAHTLAQLHGGQTISELAHAQAALVEAVRQTGGKGAIKLEIKVEPLGEGQVQLTAKVDAKVPLKAKQKTIFFTNDRNELTRSDPNQVEIAFPAPAAKAAAN